MCLLICHHQSTCLIINAPLTRLQTFIQRNHTTNLVNIDIHTKTNARPVGSVLEFSWEVLSLQLWRHISHKLLAWNDRGRLIPFPSEWQSISTIIWIKINQSINQLHNQKIQFNYPYWRWSQCLCYQLWVLNWRFFLFLLIYLSVC